MIVECDGGGGGVWMCVVYMERRIGGGNGQIEEC